MRKFSSVDDLLEVTEHERIVMQMLDDLNIEFTINYPYYSFKTPDDDTYVCTIFGGELKHRYKDFGWHTVRSLIPSNSGFHRAISNKEYKTLINDNLYVVIARVVYDYVSARQISLSSKTHMCDECAYIVKRFLEITSKV